MVRCDIVGLPLVVFWAALPAGETGDPDRSFLISGQGPPLVIMIMQQRNGRGAEGNVEVICNTIESKFGKE